MSAFTNAATIPFAMAKEGVTGTDDVLQIDQSVRIVGGSPVKEKIPFMASLIVSLKTGEVNPYCGGVLISKDWVLTAAHCLDGRVKEALSNEVTIGMTKRSTRDYLHRSGISKIVIHPSFNAAYLKNDVAMIRLKDPAPNVSIFAFLNKDKNTPSVLTSLWYVGFGLLTEGGTTIPDELMNVGVDMITVPICRYVYGSSRVSDNNICTLTKGKDSCQGDSGGPLIQPGSDGRINSGTVVGIVSWGQGCARAGKPNVNVRVSSYVDWIDATMTGSS
eukprot:CFRG0574T1